MSTENKGPFPTEDIRKKLIEGASKDAVDEAEKTAIGLYYSEVGNAALAEAYSKGMETEAIIEHVLAVLREKYADEHSNWEEIEEHLNEWVEGAA